MREAYQRKSLQGVDRKAADGAASFQTVAKIIDDLEKGGGSKQWCNNAKKRLKNPHEIKKKMP